jgi:hypothetical protein
MLNEIHIKTYNDLSQFNKKLSELAEELSVSKYNDTPIRTSSSS